MMKSDKRIIRRDVETEAKRYVTYAELRSLDYRWFRKEAWPSDHIPSREFLLVSLGRLTRNYFLEKEYIYKNGGGDKELHYLRKEVERAAELINILLTL